MTVSVWVMAPASDARAVSPAVVTVVAVVDSLVAVTVVTARLVLAALSRIPSTVTSGFKF